MTLSTQYQQAMGSEAASLLGLPFKATLAQVESVNGDGSLRVMLQDGPGEAIAPIVAGDALKSIQTHLETLAPLSARVEALEQAQQAQRLRVDVTIIAVTAFVAGLIVGLAVWWFQ